jgi:hypothetical protein
MICIRLFRFYHERVCVLILSSACEILHPLYYSVCFSWQDLGLFFFSFFLGMCITITSVYVVMNEQVKYLVFNYVLA